jgi:hypothetical protein
VQGKDQGDGKLMGFSLLIHAENVIKISVEVPYPKTTPGSKAHSYKLMKLHVFGEYGEFTVAGLIGGVRQTNIGWLNKKPSPGMPDDIKHLRRICRIKFSV